LNPYAKNAYEAPKDSFGEIGYHNAYTHEATHLHASSYDSASWIGFVPYNHNVGRQTVPPHSWCSELAFLLIRWLFCSYFGDTCISIFRGFADFVDLVG
jgi:hypothetical protein